MLWTYSRRTCIRTWLTWDARGLKNLRNELREAQAQKVDSADVIRELADLRRFANVLDSAYRIPFTSVRFGTLTGMLRPKPGDTFVADFGPFGTVEATYE